MKNISFIACIILSLNVCLYTHAQIILSYDTNNITKDEFVRAFLKNNNNQKPSENDYRDYLELYIRFKLKVKEAYDIRLDTLPNQKAELVDFRNQVAEGYLNDETAYNNLVNEAFERSQKDIHLAHIFIPFTDSVSVNGDIPDTANAWKKAMKAYHELRKGTDFGATATLYSSDKSANINMGTIGYITIFTLPYDLENLAYTTPVGKFSNPYRSKSGYHIFKNLGERKAVGKMSVAQVLFAFPHDADNAVKAAIHKQADSIYNALLNGESFSKIVTLFSKDNASYTTNGEIPQFGVGTYDASFENAVFALKVDGAITKPFLSSFGYHVVKRLAHIPVVTNPANDSAIAALKQQVKDDSRMEASRSTMLQKIYTIKGFKKPLINQRNLWTFTDSAIQNRKLPALDGISENTLLFSFPKQNVSISDWIMYLQAEKAKSYLSTTSFPDFYKRFQETVAVKYYLDHLEELDAEFAVQMRDFKEGNLLFEIMQRKIWDKAASDTGGLKKYYESNKNKYQWESSAEAVVFTCADSATANELKTRLEKNINEWRPIASFYENKVQADSGRFEIAQLPVRQDDALAPGMITIPWRNPSAPDNISFAYIVKVYSEKTLRNYDDAKGFVVNDYQAYLEEIWIKELKRKYPIKIYDASLKGLWK